jgi:hypothetical protein
MVCLAEKLLGMLCLFAALKEREVLRLDRECSGARLERDGGRVTAGAFPIRRLERSRSCFIEYLGRLVDFEGEWLKVVAGTARSRI